MLGKKVYLERIHDGSIIACEPEIDSIVEAIVKEYKEEDVCIGEVLDGLCLHGASIENATIVYARVYERIDGDKTVRSTESEDIDLANDLM